MQGQRGKVSHMPIYQATPLAGNASELSEFVKRAIPESDRHELVNSAGWFIRFNGTTIELSNALQVTGQAAGTATPVGSTLITHIVSYYGRGNTDMWEWLKTRFESQP